MWRDVGVKSGQAEVQLRLLSRCLKSNKYAEVGPHLGKNKKPKADIAS